MANAVNTPLLIRRVIVAPRPVFQVAGTCGASIAPSETCTLLISFTPMVPMSYRGVLALLDNATPRPVQVYRLTGQGSGSRPAERTNTVEAVTDGLRCEDLSALEGEESLLLNLAQNCRP